MFSGGIILKREVIVVYLRGRKCMRVEGGQLTVCRSRAKFIKNRTFFKITFIVSGGCHLGRISHNEILLNEVKTMKLQESVSLIYIIQLFKLLTRT